MYFESRVHLLPVDTRRSSVSVSKYSSTPLCLSISGASATMSNSDAQPNPTIYIQNLDSKISKDGAPFRKSLDRIAWLKFARRYCLPIHADLRRLLYSYFSRYGKVLDVIALKNSRMRGQAFVVFKDLATSTAALRKEDGRSFAGKAMRIQYARGKSYATISQESGKEALYQFRLGIVKDAGASGKLTVSGAGKALAGAGKRAAEAGDDDDDDVKAGSAAKKAKTDNAEEEEEEDEEMEMSSDDEK